MSQHNDLVHGQLPEIPERVAMDALNERWALTKAGDFKSDVDVLNYALTLEYLEAAFYQQGNARGLLSGQAAEYLRGVQKDEEAHVAAVKQTVQKLGGTPVAKPMVKFDGVFADKNKYLTTSFTFENVGVGAYLGAAGSIKSKDVLQAAAGIFGVECRHAAIVANLLGKPAEGGVYMGAFETTKSKSTVLNAVAPFLAMPAGGAGTGGGATSGIEDPGLLAGGTAAVLAAAAAAYAMRRRHDNGEPEHGEG
jgi:hypothetical protein